jgi:alpha-L-fucosidase 2
MTRKWLFLLLFTGEVAFAQEKPMPDRIRDRDFDPSTVMWYAKPATKWVEALPVGNGRLGAMVYGKPDEEVIQFNEDTYWSGGPYTTTVKGASAHLKEVQEAVFRGDLRKASDLFGRYMMGYPVEQQKYQSMGSVNLFFRDTTHPTDYLRWLDLGQGITGNAYTRKGVRFEETVLSSVPDQAIVVRLTADRPGSISFAAELRGMRNQTHSNYATDYFQMDGDGQDGLILRGRSADYMGVKSQLRYEARLKVIPEGGHMQVRDHELSVEGADAVTLVLVAATNFVNYKDVGADAHARVEAMLSTLKGRTYSNLLDRHRQDVRSMMSRVSLDLGRTPDSWLPTDERMAADQKSLDPALAALAYQFGRYVLLSSSRPGTQPANLQGIWNEDANPAWDSKYTTNINTQMNYWAVESANLSECFEPLWRMMKEMQDQGGAVAREHYGARGWVLHQNTDLWRVAAPMDGPTWGTFTVGGAWLMNECWDHWQYTHDTAFLNEYFPVLQGSVDFFLDFLVQHPNGKWMVTNPSTSPENFPAAPGNGRYFDETTGSFIPGTTICAGSSIDMEILRDLFEIYGQASTLLHADPQLRARVADIRSRLVPAQVGKDGALQEWAEDWGQLEKNHRHFSHLYGLYPGNNFTLRRTPEMVEPLKAVLEQRGDGAAGWSRAWKVALWARLHDGDRAEKIFKGYVREQAYPQFFAKCFTPMQVDGTLGMTAGITEMLMQSHDGSIDLLPALPASWSSGHFNGCRARGGFQLDLEWKDGRVTRCGILSTAGETCRIRMNGEVRVMMGSKTISVKKDAGGIVVFPTVKGGMYEVVVKG